MPKQSSLPGWAGGIPQPKNGPCGVIAVVHALVLAKQYNRDTGHIQAYHSSICSLFFSSSLSFFKVYFFLAFFPTLLLPCYALQVRADDVAVAISDILLRCREDAAAPVQLCRPKEKGRTQSNLKLS